jgi:hypothetical protein
MDSDMEDEEVDSIPDNIVLGSSNLVTPSSEDNHFAAFVSNIHLKRKDFKSPLVVTEVRSNRLKGKTKGIPVQVKYVFVVTLTLQP